jgi:hypothetical protein
MKCVVICGVCCTHFSYVADILKKVGNEIVRFYKHVAQDVVRTQKVEDKYGVVKQ